MTLNIGDKMAFGYVLLLALLVCLGIVSLTNSTGVVKQFNYVINHDAPVIANARELSKLVVDMETGQRGFVITGKEKFLEPYNEGISKFVELIEKEKELVSDNPGQVKTLEKIEVLLDQWQQKAAKPEISVRRQINVYPDTLKDVAAMIEAGTGKKILDQIREEFEKFIKLEENLSKHRYAVASANANRTRSIILIFLVGAIIIGGTVALFISRSITTPVKQLKDAVASVAKGDLTHEIKISAYDEIGQLAADFNQMVEALGHAQEALQESHMKLQEAQYVARIGDFTWDIASGAASWSDGMYELLKYDRDETFEYERVNIDIHHPDDLERVTKWLEDSIASGEERLTPNEYRVVCKDGEILYVHTEGRIEYRDGKVAALFGTCQDITERKRTEEALENEKLLIEEYINSIPGLFYVFDEQRFVRWNKKWETATGYSSKELGEMYGLDFFEGSDRDYMADRMKTVFIEGVTEAEAELVTKDGRRIPYYWTGLRKTFGGKHHLVGLGIDITDRKQAQKDKARLEEQLRQSQKMESIGTLAGGIAHDFNNMLGIIVGNTELAINDVPDWNPARHNLDAVIKASFRARDMVKQILAFSRHAEQEQKPVRIGPIIKESVRLVRSSIPTTINIREESSAHADTILGDPTQINQILMNLCTNAAHTMREAGGFLEIGLKNININADDLALFPDLTPGDYLTLTVSDTGQGMEPEIVERIFDPYFTTKTVGEGTGMGLSMVHGIVKNHNGAIRVHSEPGKGTTFNVYFPLIESLAVPETTSLESLPTGNERVLFVDDEKALADLGERMLSHFGYDVTVRTSSIEALEAFKAQPNKYDLVVTDMTMPNLSGVDLSRELLRLRPDIPIILCTGFSEIITEERAKQMGTKAFVMKPLVLSEIAQIVRQVLDQMEC